MSEMIVLRKENYWLPFMCNEFKRNVGIDQLVSEYLENGKIFE